MKKDRLLSVLLLSTVMLLTSCAYHDLHAPVETRTTVDPRIAESSAAGASSNGGQGYYTVKAGDTLYRIALDAGQTYQNLVEWNHLNNANDIKVGQVLRLTPPSTENAPSNGVAAMQPITTPATVEVTPIKPHTESSTVVPITTKNYVEPIGVKQPYSEQTLAQMQRSDSVVVAPSVPAADSTSKTDKPEAVKNAWIWPTQGKVISNFTTASKGVDISGAAGQGVVAASAGKVMYAGSGIRGYGNLVILKHDNNLLSAYAHNSKILVKEGDTVKQGEKIAEMGSSDANAVKLHFEIRDQGKPVDPLPYLPHQ